VAGTGSGDGIKALIDGTTDVANASRAMKSSEMELAKGKGVNPMAHVVALDCIVPIINPANPVSDLSIDQLRDIYMGKIKNWKEVGGEDREIVAVSRDSSSGTFEVWEEKIMKKEKVRPDAQMQASNGAVAQAVAGNKFAIGYVGIGYLNDQIKGVKVNGVMASKATALDKSYPVARELYMFTNGEPQGKAKAYIDFILSAEGQKIAEEEGFVAAR
jgi:phosphate transport system substrate-binding protein